MRIQVSHPYTNSLLLRQSPGGHGAWGDCEFVINTPLQRCDAWVVLEGLPAAQETICPRDRTIFITLEPPTEPRYPRGFVEQFGTVITCHNFAWHPRVLHRQQALPWWV